jgi:hypothetical protein
MGTPPVTQCKPCGSLTTNKQEIVNSPSLMP